MFQIRFFNLRYMNIIESLDPTLLKPISYENSSFHRVLPLD